MRIVGFTKGERAGFAKKCSHDDMLRLAKTRGNQSEIRGSPTRARELDGTSGCPYGCSAKSTREGGGSEQPLELRKRRSCAARLDVRRRCVSICVEMDIHSQRVLQVVASCR